MGIENEELMQKLVRTGMIMRHIDGEGPHGHHGHGKCEGDKHEHGESCECHDDKCECKDGHPHGHGHKKGHRRHGQMRVVSMIAMQEVTYFTRDRMGPSPG